jgi:hypothetical protein
MSCEVQKAEKYTKLIFGHDISFNSSPYFIVMSPFNEMVDITARKTFKTYTQRRWEHTTSSWAPYSRSPLLLSFKSFE